MRIKESQTRENVFPEFFSALFCKIGRQRQFLISFRFSQIDNRKKLLKIMLSWPLFLNISRQFKL